jgi:hypothetical protein
MLEGEPNQVIKRYIENDGPKEWQFAETLKWLYGMYGKIATLWFSCQDESQLALPQPVLAIAPMDVRTLAAFRLSYNPKGLSNEILLNQRWITRPRWELAESLTHETIHLFQEYSVRQKVEGFYTCTNTGHNKQFVAIAEEIGLHPKVGEGYHLRPADGQFARLMELLGEEKPPHAAGAEVAPTAKKWWWDDDRGGKPKGGSTLVLYTCATCTRAPACKIRAGRRDLEIGCRTCGGDFQVTTS